MKKAVSNVINFINDKENDTTYEWDEILFKSIVLGFSVYMLIIIDTMVYGYLTR